MIHVSSQTYFWPSQLHFWVSMLLTQEVFFHWFFLFHGTFHCDLRILAWCIFWLSAVFCPLSWLSCNCPGTHTCQTFSKFRALWHRSYIITGRGRGSPHHCTWEPPGELLKLPTPSCHRLQLGRPAKGGARPRSFERCPAASTCTGLGSAQLSAASTLRRAANAFSKAFLFHFPCPMSGCAGWVFLWFCVSTTILYGSI